jgi:sugar lactone lactonase YvrE
MNRYAGKARIGVIAILGVAALAIVGLHRFSGRAFSADPTPTIFVTDSCSEAVTAYPAASNGDVSPAAPAPTGLSEPELMAIDPSGNIYVANTCTNTVTIYAKGSKGNAAPTAVIGGPATGLNSPQGIALDSNRNIYVTGFNANNGFTAAVFVYPPLGGSTGLLNEAPTATIGGTDTGLTNPWGIALDPTGNIYAADFSAASVLVYPALGSSTGPLNEAPTATISGSDTGLINPVGIALDSTRNIYVADFGATSVFVYPPVGSSTGPLNEAPTATISGLKTGLFSPEGVALDSSEKIYVADSSAVSVFVYSALGKSTGTLNESPTDTIDGISTALASPVGIALDSNNKIYVADNGVNSVFVYPAGSNGNIAPSSTTISTTLTTGLSSPQGIALDSSGKIYVVDDGLFQDGPPSVFVYAAASNANAVPSATITGSNTDLVEPVGIALDSNGKIYVADPGATSVFFYPEGSNGNVTPSGSIAGPDTLLSFPFGIALDSNGNIYVADDGNDTCDGTQSVYVYPAKSNGDIAPSAIINGTNTGLCFPSGIATDSSGNIYVTDSDEVLVYPPLSAGCTSATPCVLDELPTATISGSSTGLLEPIGVVLDSTGNIYVPDLEADSVFVYPPLGSSTGTLNEAPSATISGPNTELGAPLFIAFQSAATLPTPTATATPTVTPTAVSTPTTLSAAPTTIKFGNVDATATSKSKKVTLTNKGTATAVIGSVTATPPFAVAGSGNTCAGQSIAAKKKCSFDVDFAPATPGAVSDGSIDVSYNGTSPNVSLSGDGIAVTLKAPSKETFSPVPAGGMGKAKKIKISNPATVSVSLGATSIGGSDPTAFTISANSCAGTLAAKGNCTITMEFTPGASATGAQSATVGFSYTYGANDGNVSIPISGTVK